MQKKSASVKTFIKKHLILVSILTVVTVLIVSSSIKKHNEAPDWTTDTVSTGTVRNVVSVSGTIDAVGSAELAFPTGGTIQSIAVKEGETVTKGATLATLVHNDLGADYEDALAAVRIAEADRDAIMNGMRPEERDVAKTKAEIARQDLVRITNEQNERVQNAYKTLLSSDLEARPKDSSIADAPPTITGTYSCKEGTYNLKMFSSSARSGYSFKLSGLETGIYSAYTESPAFFGACGLSIQFVPGVGYANTEWEIEIPNKNSASYITNQNAYTLAVTQRDNAIREATQQVTLAEQNLTLDTANPREEDASRAEAKVMQARARLGVVSAQIKDHVLTAPFDGTITNIEPVAGEAVGTSPIITMVSPEAFALTALIPEIDITRVSVGQKAEVVFDARQDETLVATIIFISPLAKEIDGVSYFEAKLALDSEISWLRSGLNADINIIIDTHENVTRIPKRYLIGSEGSYTVLVPDGKKTTKSVPVQITFTGNDGFVEVTGVDVGTTIVAP